MTHVREIPPGSGINGRPILEDGRHHIAEHRRDGAWYTFCGQRVPDDHLCPPWGEILETHPANCIRCDYNYRTAKGWPIRPEHPGRALPA